MRECSRCKGTGKLAADAYQAERTCYTCDGAGQFTAPDYEAIRSLIINPKSGKLFSTSLRTKAGRKRAQEALMGKMPPSAVDRMARRAQYVWRMAMWNSGMDGRGANLGGAIMADMDLGADPYKVELDGLADMIADKCYGKGASLRSASRWHRALYGA